MCCCLFVGFTRYDSLGATDMPGHRKNCSTRAGIRGVTSTRPEKAFLGVYKISMKTLPYDLYINIIRDYDVDKTSGPTVSHSYNRSPINRSAGSAKMNCAKLHEFQSLEFQIQNYKDHAST